MRGFERKATGLTVGHLGFLGSSVTFSDDCDSGDVDDFRVVAHSCDREPTGGESGDDVSFVITCRTAFAFAGTGKYLLSSSFLNCFSGLPSSDNVVIGTVLFNSLGFLLSKLSFTCFGDCGFPADNCIASVAANFDCDDSNSLFITFSYMASIAANKYFLFGTL